MGIRHALILALVVTLATFAADAFGGEEAVAITASPDALTSLGVTAERLEYHARIETGLALASPGVEAPLRVYVDPSTDGAGVALTLVDRTRSRTESRVIALADVPVAERARVVALALAEMIRARGSASPPPPVIHAEPAPPRDVDPPPPRSPPRFAAEVAGGASYFSKQGSALVEARLAGERAFAGPLAGRAEIGVGFGGGDDPVGDAHLVLPSIGLGVRLRSDPRGAISFGVGPSAGVGVALASGSSASGRATSKEALTIRLSIDADVRVRLGGPLYFTLGVSAGVMPRGADVRADDRLVTSASGLALGALGGVGVVLP